MSQPNGDAKWRPAEVSWNDFDALGFDLDHTLARYKLPAQSKLCFKSISRYMHESDNWPASVQELDDSFATDFMRRGLVFDTETCLLLKLSHSGEILRACRGTKPVTKEEIVQHFPGLQYPEERFSFIRTHCTGHATVKMMDNNFYTPAMGVLARLVDLGAAGSEASECTGDEGKSTGQGAGERTGQTGLYERMLKGAMDSFNPAHYKQRKGYYFPEMEDRPMEYIYPVSSELKAWLAAYRASGRVTFLVTNSHVDYALLVLNTCLGGDNWRQYLDFLVCAAMKPVFFSGDRPFTRWDEERLEAVPHSGDLQRGCIYLHGNAAQLHSSLRAMLGGTRDVRSAFFGDSLSSDVIPAAQSGIFHPVAVIEEVHTEYVQQPHSPHTGGEEPANKKPKTDAFAHYAFAGPWGSVFTCTSQSGANEKTLLTHVLETNCLLTIPTVEVLTETSPDHKMKTFASGETLAGYFPRPPAVFTVQHSVQELN